MDKFLNYKLTTIALAMLLFWVSVHAWGIYQQRRHVDQQAAQIQARIDVLDKENQKLQADSDYYKSQDYLEKQARLQLNYKSADENVVFVYTQTASTQTQAHPQSSQPWFKRLWEFLKP